MTSSFRYYLQIVNGALMETCTSAGIRALLDLLNSITEVHSAQLLGPILTADARSAYCDFVADISLSMSMGISVGEFLSAARLDSLQRLPSSTRSLQSAVRSGRSPVYHLGKHQNFGPEEQFG